MPTQTDSIFVWLRQTWQISQRLRIQWWWAWLVAAVLSQGAFVLMDRAQHFWQLPAFILVALVAILFCSIFLWLSQRTLAQQETTQTQLVDFLVQNLVRINFGSFLYLLLNLIVFSIGHLLVQGICASLTCPLTMHALLMLLLAILPLTVGLLLTFWWSVLLMLTEQSVLLAFRRSIRLSMKFTPRTFLIYGMSVVWFFAVDRYTLHGQFFAQHYLSFTWSAVASFILLPWIFAMLINVVQTTNELFF